MFLQYGERKREGGSVEWNIFNFNFVETNQYKGE